MSRSCGCIRKSEHVIAMNKYDLTGKFGIGWTTNTNAEFYFDLEDYELIRKYCWYESDTHYIITQRNRKTIRMHRLIMGVDESNEQIDHIFHNTFDNRKEFLRVVNNSQNNMNKKTVGVYWDKSRSKWVANITYNGKRFSKRFDSFEEAKIQRIEYEKKYFKEYVYKDCGWSKCG